MNTNTKNFTATAYCQGSQMSGNELADPHGRGDVTCPFCHRPFVLTSTDRVPTHSAR